ncbi:GAF domain-containing protein [Roseofilum sp. BLCC_M143]|uniref:GAF domain-containing protein n=2 Tax=Roseofilum TaxID=1233426 RepID=A0ABT7BS59_9CYAN|nr:GAF domain-containing protein [Roseofilum casamattae BLCC-M143]
MNLLGDRSLQAKLDVTLRTVSWKIAEILEAEHVTFFVADSEAQQLWSKNAIGPNGTQIDLAIPMDVGIAGHVARTGESLNVPDPYQDERFNPNIDRETGFTTRNILCLPLLDESDRIFAVVQALNKQGDGSFGPEDEQRFVELVSSLGTVLQTSVFQAQQSRANFQS